MTLSAEEMRAFKKHYRLTNDQISTGSGVPLGTVQKIFSGETKNSGYKTMALLEQFFLSLEEKGYRYLPTSTSRKGILGNAEVSGKAEILGDAEVPNRAGILNNAGISGSVGILGEGSEDYGSTVARNPHHEQRYTIQDYFIQPNDRRAELIAGRFCDMAAPSIRHQRIVGSIYRQLADYLDKEQCGCEAFIAPCAVQPDPGDESTVLEPDVFAVCDPSKITDTHIVGAPDLVIEVASPGTSGRDAGIKLNIYRNAGVKEYWMIDPQQGYAVIYTLQKDNADDGQTVNEYPFPEIHSLKEPIPVITSERKLMIDLRAEAERE